MQRYVILYLSDFATPQPSRFKSNQFTPFRFDRLQNLLNRSEAYSSYLLGRVNKRREEEEEKAAAKKKKKETEAARTAAKEENKKVNEKARSERSLRSKDVSSSQEQVLSFSAHSIFSF